MSNHHLASTENKSKVTKNHGQLENDQLVKRPGQSESGDFTKQPGQSEIGYPAKESGQSEIGQIAKRPVQSTFDQPVKPHGPTKKERLDIALVNAGAFSTRTKAQEAIAQSRIVVDGKLATKPSQKVAAHQLVSIKPVEQEYITRAGNKLASVLTKADLSAKGQRCLDAGCAHGGFTDVLLQQGATSVIAVDVATGQFDKDLSQDSRVYLVESTNIRHLQPADLPTEPPTFIVADLSFISLTLVLSQLVTLAAPSALLLPMVKPQFEIDPNTAHSTSWINKQGVVKHSDGWVYALQKVLTCATNLELRCEGIVPSAVPGAKGNVEFFLILRKNEMAQQDEQHYQQQLDMFIMQAIESATTMMQQNTM